MKHERAQVLVVGSGAGGATTAHELAHAGLDVLVLEEGARHDLSDYGKRSTQAMAAMYRRSGMTPIVGRVPMGYVEGCCVGGSTEINSGFWHRTPPEVLLRWEAQFDLAQASPEDLAPHMAWAEEQLGVTTRGRPWPKSTEVFARGIEAMGWVAQEVPRTAPGCESSNTCATGCAKGHKQGVSRRVLPEAEAAGARVVEGCRVSLVLHRKHRASGVLVERAREDGTRELLRIDADHVFVCAGPSETPSLLRRSGIKQHVGDTLRVHPMLKVVAHFPEPIDAESSVLPLLQVKEFWPDISLGGAFFTAGHVAMTLSDNWIENRAEMRELGHLGTYYVAVKGTGRGHVRPSLFGETSTLRYDLSHDDLRHLSTGLARLATVLLAAGATCVYPSVAGMPALRSRKEAVRWLDDVLPSGALSLSTVHAFSTCPMGEREDRCAASSFGKLHGFENLYINDASMLPDSPGVNPQGSVMAFARRNAMAFRETMR
jgi:choline dehydrogenase-like flavoprotein